MCLTYSYLMEMGIMFQNHISYLVFLFCILSCLHLAIAASGCNIYQGSWVASSSSSPFYDSSKCPFIDKQFNCQKNGRPDKLYLSYTWKPTSCDLPRFSGLDFLRRLKGKKIMFVGDSLSFNQWQSLTCMLHTAVPQGKYNLTIKDSMSTYTFPDFGVSLMFDHNVFLVDLVTKMIGRVLKIDSITTGNSWKYADFIIFNTWHWWVHKGPLQLWDYIEYGGKTYKDMDRLVAFRRGLTTWSKWVDKNINPATTRVFFQGISPTHYNAEEWNGTNGNCKGETKPISGSTYRGGSPPAVVVVKYVLKKMSKPVELLDVTTLSQLRKDGHPYIYGSGGYDCAHWCLAGVPDTWNHLLYTSIVRS